MLNRAFLAAVSLAFARLFYAPFGIEVAAQSTGMIKGQVVDAGGDPIAGAEVTLIQESPGRRFRVKTNAEGRFIQIGLQPGYWSVVVDVDDFQLSASIRMTIGAVIEQDFKFDVDFPTSPQGDPPPDRFPDILKEGMARPLE